MAVLKKCNYCGKKISSLSDKCIHCGHDIPPITRCAICKKRVNLKEIPSIEIETEVWEGYTFNTYIVPGGASYKHYSVTAHEGCIREILNELSQVQKSFVCDLCNKKTIIKGVLQQKDSTHYTLSFERVKICSHCGHPKIVLEVGKYCGCPICNLPHASKKYPTKNPDGNLVPALQLHTFCYQVAKELGYVTLFGKIKLPLEVIIPDKPPYI
jgi:rRNA maturation protein Nop10